MNRAFLLSAALIAAAPHAMAVEPHAAMQAYVNSEILTWAQDAVIVDAIRAQNVRTAGYDAAQIDALDLTWRAEVGTGSSAMIDAVLINAAADFLRSRIEASDGMITEVFIMDAHGLNVAASGATSDYWQGDEAKFQETYPKGAGAVHFGEIEFDESSQTYQAQISVTITDPASGAPIGAMTVGIDAETLM
ncbi:cache domain-containing protein [Maliponia aquimaris]|uniref:Uncharacterized protein n=1 Tax=Maliponia aquimaris TaxID=1673631 RepID=A0A238KQM7_9RHOB|nr:cache domain-containing protein [Maliponia aquimaris]SMX45113.1 hypothetical protein MAA8898_03146 [Maliponia aquimaris]